ncbi:MAG: PLP-dependent aminotransferase family protein [Propionibacteriaceae bacterium]
METISGVPARSGRVNGVKSSVVRDRLALTERPGVISFAGGLPAPELFDVQGARASFDAVLGSEPGRALQYSPTEGNRELRASIAARYTAQGVPTQTEDILITTGSQQGLSLLATTLVDSGDVVLVESPSYLAALQCFQLAGATLVEVPSAGPGIDLEALAGLARIHRPKALYTVATFHNPTGRTLSAENRSGIVELAQRFGFRVIEDDPYRELRYSGAPVPSMATFADGDHVVCTGSLSKILAPGLRLGWVRTNPGIKSAIIVAKQAADLHTSTLDQAAAAHYLASGRLDANLDRSRVEYRRRRDAMLAGLPQALPAGSTWNQPDGGMFLWAALPEGYDTADVLIKAIEHDVAFVPGAPFFATDPQRNTMRISFITYPPEKIAEGTRRLGEVFAELGA